MLTLRKNGSQFFSQDSSTGSTDKVVCSCNVESTNGSCLCPNCGKKKPRQDGESCAEVICPQCGSQMMKD